MKKRADGRYQKVMTDPRTGQKLFFYGRTVQELNGKILAYREEQERGRTFAQVSEEWWELAEPRLADQSQRGYARARMVADNELGSTPVREIQPRHILALLERMARQDYSQKIIDRQKMVINQIFQHAVMEGDITFNPCSSIRSPRGKAPVRRPAASEEDEERIRQSAGVWLLPFFAMMTGMRKGELLALRWEDIDLEQNLIHVTKSVAHRGDRPFIKEPKTQAGCRVVPLLDPLKEELLKIPDREPERLLFSDDGKKLLSNRRYISLMNHYKKTVGTSCGAHMLRHSFATLAFEAEVQDKAVQQILGHRQLSTTMDLYTDFRKKSLEKAAETLNSSFSQKSQKE